MTKDEALEVVSQACASVVANLESHQRIQAALQVIASGLSEAETKKAK